MKALAPLTCAGLFAVFCSCGDPVANSSPSAPIDDAGGIGNTDGAVEASVLVDASPSDGGDASATRDGGDASPPGDPRDGPGIFAAVGNSLRHVRSLDDGLTWVDDATDIAPDAAAGDATGIRTTTWLNNQFIAFAAKIVSSPDGKTWTEWKHDGQWLASMVYAQGQYVSSGGYGWLATTTGDLASWTQHPPRADYTTAHHSRNALAYGKVKGIDAYVVVNDAGEIFHANDGKTWLASTGAPVVPAGNTWGTQFVYGDGVFVGLLPSGTETVRSTDGGATWTSNAAFGAQAASLVHAQGHFTAVGSGHVLTSPDGQTWTDQVAPTAPYGDLTYGHGVYLSLVWNSKVYRSTNSRDWTMVFDGQVNPNGIASIAFGPNP